jgi:hypothetical protein
MSFDESTNWHDDVTIGQELGKAERQLDAAITNMVGGSGSSASGLQVIYVSTSTGVVQATTSEGTILGSSGVGSLDLPADFFAEGVTLRFTARGYYSSVDGGDNLEIRLYLNSTEVISTGVFLPDIATNRYWEISGLITCRSAGETGTVMPNGHISYNGGEGMSMISTTNVTIDTTGELTFDITAEWAVSDPDNSVSCTNLVLEKLQVGNSSLAPADVVVEFDSASSTATTESHDIDVVLTLPAGSQIASAVTVDWDATNVDAPTSGTVTFPAGSSNGAVQTITIDLDYGGNPVVTLSNVSSNATLGAEDTHTVTVQMDVLTIDTSDSDNEQCTAFNSVLGQTYTLVVSGNVIINTSTGQRADAFYTTTDNWSTHDRDVVTSSPYPCGESSSSVEIRVDGNTVSPVPDYESSHVYTFEVTGTGVPICVRYCDRDGLYGNNSGSFTVHVQLSA